MANKNTGSEGSGVRAEKDCLPPPSLFTRKRADPAELYGRDSVTIEIPIGPLRDGGQVRHVDAQLRTREQRETMRRIFTGLDLCGARTRNDKRVTNMVEAVLWLLEQVAAAIAAEG